MRSQHALFPLAAAYALTAIPFWLALRTGHATLADGSWHGHEMLFGFALAVIAGFLATRPPRLGTAFLAGTWLTARIAATVGSDPLAACVELAFPVAVLGVTAPPLFRGAKRSENRILPLILTALVVADAIWWAGRTREDPLLQTHALLATVDLISLLLLHIGGRALRAAAGALLERRGIARRDRVWRRYELPLAAVLGTAALCDGVGLTGVAGALCLAAAMLALARLLPGQIHRTLAQPSLWTLALGFLWLIPGLAVKGMAQLVGTVPVADMLHGITVGALGTLTLVMMSRYSALRARKPLSEFTDVGVAASLVSVAATIRLLVPVLPAGWHWLLWLAALAWSGAFLALLVRLWRTFRHSLTKVKSGPQD